MSTVVTTGLVTDWMLKMLCGFAYSGNLVVLKPGLPSPKDHPPPLWLLETIFGRRPLPAQKGGLHVYTYPPSHPNFFSNGMNIRVEPGDKVSIGGISIHFGGLVLHTQTASVTAEDSSLQILHRPKRIILRDEDGTDALVIELAWGSLTSGGEMVVQRRLSESSS